MNLQTLFFMALIDTDEGKDFKIENFQNRFF